MVFKPKLTPMQRQFVKDVYRADRELRPDGVAARRNLRKRLAAMFGVNHNTIWRAAFDIKPAPKPRKKRRRKVKKKTTGRGPMALRTHCPQGHEYTPENTNVLAHPLKDGTVGYKRQCIACKKGWKPKSKRLELERAAREAAHAQG